MDIVDRLREFEHNWADKFDMADACQDAADEIERLREALKLCSGWVEAYGEPETKEKVRAALTVPNAKLTGLAPGKDNK